jgi:hypothetical protein
MNEIYSVSRILQAAQRNTFYINESSSQVASYGCYHKGLEIFYSNEPSSSGSVKGGEFID